MGLNFTGPCVLLAPVTDIFNHVKDFGVTPPDDLPTTGKVLHCVSIFNNYFQT